MYDWPERRAEVDAEWAALRDRLRARGIAAPQDLTRRNADMPAVPGGIRDAAGMLIAPDPATLPPDELDVATLWRHPRLLFSQTCWGPMETTGFGPQVRVVGQPDYSAFEGGEGEFYRSAIVMRKGEELRSIADAGGLRFAFNERHSMSGYLAPARDLAKSGIIAEEDAFPSFWSAMVETHAHRASVKAVAEGQADVAAIDCRTWAYCRRFEPAAAALAVIGWTAPRTGLPFITAKDSPLKKL
jgi:ABC-type phosphate/phosphonate transport system substrate-binding protein